MEGGFARYQSSHSPCSPHFAGRAEGRRMSGEKLLLKTSLHKDFVMLNLIFVKEHQK